jgi:hypothetical protein
MGQYSATANQSVANIVSGAGTPATNIFRMPRRNFNGNGVGIPWAASGGTGTITDNNGVGWDGSNEASTLNMTSPGGTNPWQIGYSDNSNLPAGTYTIAVNVKSNSGSNEVFRFNESVGFSPTQTATTSWTRVKHTFTAASPFSITNESLMADFVTNPYADSKNANLIAMDLDLYPGSTDLEPVAPDSHF